MHSYQLMKNAFFLNENINNFQFLVYKHFSSEVELALLTNLIKITQNNPIFSLLLGKHIR